LFSFITAKRNNILIVHVLKKVGMLISGGYRSVMVLLILVGMLPLAYLHEANAQYTRVDDTSSGRGMITCPTGELHEGAISIASTSTPSMSGYYDIVTEFNGSSALKSGVFDYVKIYSSGEFVLKGKETRDDICDGLTGIGSIRVEITGQCVFSPSDPPTIVKFRAANGEKADFPSAPTCS